MSGFFLRQSSDSVLATFGDTRLEINLKHVRRTGRGRFAEWDGLAKGSRKVHAKYEYESRSDGSVRRLQIWRLIIGQRFSTSRACYGTSTSGDGWNHEHERKTHDAGQFLKLGTGILRKVGGRRSAVFKALDHVWRCNCQRLPAEHASSSLP